MMFGWHHLCNGHELGHTLGDGGRQGDLACCSPCSHKEPDTTWQLNNKEIIEHNPSSLLLQFSYSLLTTVTWVVFCLFCFFYGLLCVCVCVCSVTSDSLQPHGLQPARLLCLWNFLGKNTGEGCISYSRGSSQLRYRNCMSCVSCIGRGIPYHCAT